MLSNWQIKPAPADNLPQNRPTNTSVGVPDPRASQYLTIGAKCHAALQNKYSPDIEDVKAVALPILRHRIVANYKAEAEGIKVDDIIRELL